MLRGPLLDDVVPGDADTRNEAGNRERLMVTRKTLDRPECILTDFRKRSLADCIEREPFLRAHTAKGETIVPAYVVSQRGDLYKRFSIRSIIYIRHQRSPLGRIERLKSDSDSLITIRWGDLFAIKRFAQRYKLFPSLHAGYLPRLLAFEVELPEMIACRLLPR